jgi:NAD(P) transhydrogenase subunit alpha
MIIAVPKETAEHEKRVALAPDTVAKLVDKELNVQIEKGAGRAANYVDSAYEEAGAAIVNDRSELFTKADLLLSIQTPPENDLKKLREKAVLICFLEIFQNEE